MIDAIVRAVHATPGVSEYAIAERAVVRRVVTTAADRVDRRHTAHVHVFVDGVAGRGQTAFDVREHDLDDLTALVRRAADRAARGRGPAWTLPPPGAPARVAVFDARLSDPDAAAAIASALVRATRGGGPVEAAAGEPIRVDAWRVAVDSERVEVAASTGLRTAYRATRATVDAIVAPVAAGAPRAAVVAIARRRRADLALGRELVAAGRRVRALRRAEPVAAGRYAIALDARAVDHAARIASRRAHDPRGPERFGWFAPLAHHADGGTARRGVARYLPGASIFGERDATGDPLSVASDGALPFGLASAPVGDLGEPVRRFALVTDGVAAGLGLDAREAGLRGVPANGGVRNLVVAPGSLDGRSTRDVARAAGGDEPTLAVDELADVHVDLVRGSVTAIVAAGEVDGRPVAGAAVTLNLYEALAAARWTRAVVDRGWYRGPTAWWLPGARVA